MNQPNENQAGWRERRHFDETYKRHAVELTLRGDRGMKEIARELGVTGSMLQEWRQIYAPKPTESGSAPCSPEDAQEEITRLRAEVVRLRERETILKKSLNILRTARERCARIDAMKGEHAVDLLCEMLTVSRSGYYRWKSAGPCKRERDDDALAPRWQRRIVVLAASMARPG